MNKAMQERQTNWFLAGPGLLLLAFSVWQAFSGGELIAGPAVILAFILVYFSKDREPELDEAMRRSFSQFLWVIPLAAVYIFFGYLLTRTGGNSWVHLWILAPAFLLAHFWIGVVRPCVTLFRAHKKIQERYQREANKNKAMLKQQTKWHFFVPGLLLLPLGAWGLFNDNLLIGGPALFFSILLLSFAKETEPEFVEAMRRSFKQFLWLVPIFAIWFLGGLFLARINGEWAILWILMPGVGIAAFWIGAVRPCIFIFRAFKKIRQRKQREAE